jgi:hypothetical protein
MFLQTKDSRTLILQLVSAYSLEYPHAIVQSMRQDMDFGITPVNQLAIHPDKAVAVGHRHEVLLEFQQKADAGFYRPEPAGTVK